MKLIEFHNVSEFAARVNEFFIAREAERCVELGIMHGLLDGRSGGHRGHDLEIPLLWLVEDARGQVVATAVQSVVDRIIISRGPVEAMRLIARNLADAQWTGTEINGQVPSMCDFIAEYSKLSGRNGKRSMQLRTFQLDRVTPPRAAPGRARRADERDRALLGRWTLAFARAIGDKLPDEEGARMADRLLTDQRAWLWETDQPLAMAAHAGPTPNGIRVNYVYTPDENRGRGYASNLVAAISQHHLDAGKRFVFLHTDEANPTSNRIYQAIGYAPVSDSERWTFATGTGTTVPHSGHRSRVARRS